MSAGYASRLSTYPNKGVCGLPESRDTPRAYKVKIDALVEAIKGSSRIVIVTGAGISTSAGIPDFRGPKGVWTQEQEKKKKHKATRKRSRDETCKDENEQQQQQLVEPPPSMDFASAKPTFTHRAIACLIDVGVFHFCVTQNVDGLHQRSGLSRDKLSVLHGCAFTEKCETCGTEHFRDTDVGGMSFHKTGRQCEVCSGDLRDTLLDWDDPLPEADMARSENECERADLVICLGTSLRIFPANQLPLKAKKFVVVNLQQTMMDDEASLIIREKVDTVLKDIMDKLGHELNENKTPKIERFWKMKAENDNHR